MVVEACGLGRCPPLHDWRRTQFEDGLEQWQTLNGSLPLRERTGQVADPCNKEAICYTWDDNGMHGRT